MSACNYSYLLLLSIYSNCSERRWSRCSIKETFGTVIGVEGYNGCCRTKLWPLVLVRFGHNSLTIIFYFSHKVKLFVQLSVSVHCGRKIPGLRFFCISHQCLNMVVIGSNKPLKKYIQVGFKGIT